MIKNLFKLILVAGIFNACTTEDISPTIEITSSDPSNSITEEESIDLTITLSGATNQNVSLDIDFSGSAQLGSDISVSSNTITIEKGQTEGTLSISGLQDGEVEDLETIIINVSSSEIIASLSNTNFEISIIDLDSLVDTDNDGVFDFEDNCPSQAGQASNNGCPFLGIFNEVLYDPPSGDAGDANNDGTRDANGDEFIEIYNSGPGNFDLTGYTISDAEQVRHTFPSGTIMGPNSVLVLFGSGSPTGDFGGAIVQTASEGLINMNNSGDFVTMADPNGNPIITFDVEPLSNNPNESYTRFPDITGDFVQHNADIPEANGALFSPGTRIDGTNF